VLEKAITVQASIEEKKTAFLTNRNKEK